ncbi:type II secretion system protein N [Henriciella marina]|uniref:type II secretion system protein N n=1 Tax=Henriciella marina TaxID=453851 RepID=UPI00037544B2|nr:type II secretion system protein N [Henriciella marina]
MGFEGRLSLPVNTGRLIEAARLALQFVLVILFAMLLARVIWLLIAPADAVSTLTLRPLPTPIQQTTRANARGDLSLLLTTNPFVSSGRTAEIVPDAPETTLNLKLVAIFMSTDPTADSATIVTPDNQTARFQPGEEIIPGTRLERVLSDRVIISRNGTEETLMRGGREAGLSVIGSPSDARQQTSTVQQPRTATFSPGVTARTLLASMNPIAETDNGAVEAFVLQPRSNPGLMQDAGLEPGDRLIRINNRPVFELDTAALAAELGSAQTVSVTVLRGGEARNLDIRFEEG